MTKTEVEKIIKENPCFQQFIEDPHASMCVDVVNIPILIYKEGVGVSFYYRFPQDSNADYSDAYDFMRYAYPIISRALEKKREENLYAPGNIRRATLK